MSSAGEVDGYMIHMATPQRGPSEATTGRRIPPPTSCRTSTFVRRSEDQSDVAFRSLAERREGGQRQDDGYERRELKDRPDRLPSRKSTVDICERTASSGIPERSLSKFGAARVVAKTWDNERPAAR